MRRSAGLGLSLLLFAAGCDESTASKTSGAGPPAAATAPGGVPTRGEETVVARKCNDVCHKPGNVFKAPLLAESVKARAAAMADYPNHVERLKATDRARYDNATGRIEEILRAPAGDPQLALWLRTYLAEPTFDDGQKRMTKPSPPLTQSELDHIVAYLLTLK